MKKYKLNYSVETEISDAGKYYQELFIQGTTIS